MKFKARYIFFIIIFAPLFLGHSGYCSKENRWLGKREVVDRFLFGDNNDLNQKQKIILSKEKELGEYPNNCAVLETVHNGLLLYFNISCIYPRATSKKDSLGYYHKIVSIDACGKNLDYIGESIDYEFYKVLLNKNKEYWENES